MENIFQLIIFVLFIVAFAILVVDNIKSRITMTQLNKDIAQSLLDLMALKQKLEQTKPDKAVEETEGFLKFVSQSRDWAFQYIERVQIAIKEFQDAFHPIAIEYYKNKNRPINQEEFGRLFEAYKKLVEELPEEGKKK